MYSLINPYKWTACGNGNLEFLTDAKASIDYKRIITQNQFSRNEFYDLLARQGADFLKCTSCGKIFYIDWSDNKWPEPIVQDTKLVEFFSSWKYYKLF